MIVHRDKKNIIIVNVFIRTSIANKQRLLFLIEISPFFLFSCLVKHKRCEPEIDKKETKTMDEWI